MTPTRPSILLVEDEPAHAEAICRAFQAGAPEYEVRVAGSLREFRDQVAARPPTLALLDLNLPDGRAVDVLVSPPEAGPCPILVMTSHGDETTAVAALRAGALDYVVKSPESFAGMPQSAARVLREWQVRVERLQAEQALRRSEARLRRALQAGNVGLWEWDFKTSRVYYSPEWKRQLGCEDHEIGDDFEAWRSRVHPDDQERVEKQVQASLEAPWPDYEVQYRLRHKNGAYRTILSQGAGVWDDQGRMVYFVGTHIDLTERKRVEEALTQSEGRLRSLYEQCPIGIWEEDFSAVQARFAEWRAAGVADWPAFFAQHPEAVRECAALVRILDVNLTSARLLGEQCKEHLITSLPQCFTEESYRVFGHELAVLAGGDTHFEGEVPVRQRSGKEVRLLLSLSVVPGHEATLDRVLVSFVDVTARAHAEAALQSSQAELTAVYENAPVIMLLLDEERRVVRLNRAAREFAARPDNELLGLHGGDLLGCIKALDDPQGCGYGPDCASCALRQTVLDALTTGRPHTGVVAQPKLVRGEQLREFWVSLSAARITVAGQRRVLLCIEDITARQRAEEELSRAEQFARGVLDGLAAHIAVVNQDGVIVAVNQAWRDFASRHGLPGDTAGIGDNYLRVCDNAAGPHGEEAAPFAAGLREVLAGRSPRFELEYECPEIKGWFLVRVTPVPDPRSRLAVVAHEDITPRKVAEAELQLNEARLERIADLAQVDAQTRGELLNLALTSSVELTASLYGYLFLYDDGSQEFTVHNWSAAALKDCAVPEPPRVYALAKTGLWGEVVRQRGPIFLNNFTAENPLKKGFPQGHVGLTRFMSVPVFSGDRIVAVVGVANKASDYTHGDVLQLTLLLSAAWKLVERKDAEAALRASEEHYRSLFDHMLNGFAFCRIHLEQERPVDFTYLKVNGAFETLTGLKNVEGRRVSELIPGIREKDPNLFELYGRVALTGVPEHVELEVASLEMWFAVAVYSPAREYFVAIFDVITERKRAEAELRESKARLDLALRSVNMGVWQVDLATGRRTYDDVVCRLQGIDPATFGGTQEEFLRTVHPEDRERVEAALAFALEHRTLYQPEYRVVWPDGSVHYVAARAQVILDGAGQPARVVGVAWDTTERQRLEAQFRQAQKMEAVGQLVGGVAHDFNNILAGVLLHLDALQDEPGLAQETRAGLKDLVAEAKRGANLTRQLLMYSRRSVLQVKSIDLNELIENLLKMLRRLLGEQIDLRFHGRIGLPRIDADPGMIEQVVVNLAVNARDAMIEGGPLTLSTFGGVFDEARARLHPDRRAGRFVCLSVADAGCGMDEPTLKRIFEPFFTTKDVGKGTGLGLATVQGIAAQHKGWVEVESQPGKGSTFRVFLPESTLTPGKLSAAAAENQPPPRGDETILLVEDEANVRRSASVCLRLLGYQVWEAANGIEAMSLWSQHQQEIDLLLTDLVMPEGMSGLQLAQRLRRAKPGLSIIIISGYSAGLVEQGLLPTDHFVFLPKPFDAAMLGRTVRSCLDRKPPAS